MRFMLVILELFLKRLTLPIVCEIYLHFRCCLKLLVSNEQITKSTLNLSFLSAKILLIDEYQTVILKSKASNL